MKKIFALHFFSLFIPIIVGITIHLGGAWCWTNFILGATTYPLLDFFISLKKEPSPNQFRFFGDLAIYLTSFFQTLLLIFVFFILDIESLTRFELLGIVFSLATVTGGIGIPMAHELIHRNSKRQRILGLFLLSNVLYMHFRIEHIYGHHSNVGTKEDPATARFGESFWSFLPRSIFGQIKSAIMIESNIHKSSKTKQPLNRMHSYVIIQLSVLVIIYTLSGGIGLICFLGQAFVAIFFLEAINYVEHYGLERSSNSKIDESISWNTEGFFTNAFLFNLGYHSDHHCRPSLDFTELKSRKNAPQLPGGYLWVMLVATIPPLWKKIIHPRLKKHSSKARE